MTTPVIITLPRVDVDSNGFATHQHVASHHIHGVPGGVTMPLPDGADGYWRDTIAQDTCCDTNPASNGHGQWLHEPPLPVGTRIRPFGGPSASP